MSFDMSLKKLRKPEVVRIEESNKFAACRSKSHGKTSGLSAILRGFV